MGFEPRLSDPHFESLATVLQGPICQNFFMKFFFNGFAAPFAGRYIYKVLTDSEQTR